MPDSKGITPRILRIPGEIRNQIYTNLVVFAEPVPIYRHGSSAEPPDDSLVSLDALTPLFLTCRQFYGEASAIFYSQNKFALPSSTSHAPHQIQANLLFRHFLDRIGPRNASLLRHLTLPFPVDPSDLIHSHLSSASTSTTSASTSPSTRLADTAWQDEANAGCRRSLVPVLRQRCPRLETVEFDLRWDGRWVRLLRPHTATARAVFGRVDDALRGAFPALKTVGLCLTGSCSQQQQQQGVSWGADGQAAEVAVEEGRGWQVTVAEEEEEDDDDEDEGAYEEVEDDDEASEGWASTWYPRTPRHPTALLWEPPETAIQSELHDQWTRLDLLKANAKFAMAWVRSPSRATQQREEVLEWRAWRQTMLAQAAPVGVPLYCPRTNASTPPRLSRRESLKRGVLGLFTFRG
ncbi:hypothetical protein NEMBOFW57_000057 [Staphylotrichum longicolle]|uniref:F-box domain-containing protein n=1 Tax=Staphylotrichum longicolle TaxID=669026 RepID=A0AAD4EZ64_9PEZI|nr:hypothetical protein NEMBOFW57_000057 [Staphylotrichum longicolle]